MTNGPNSPWEELAEQAHRLPQTNRIRVSERDRALRAAVRSGSSIRELAERLDVSVQAVYQAVERADGELHEAPGSVYRTTLAAVKSLTDPVTFEELVNLLLAEFLPDLRPTQRSGDRGRDAVAGQYRLGTGEELVVTISLRKDWSEKVRSDMRNLVKHGLRPATVYAVTNRETDERRLETLRTEAAGHGWSLIVFDGRWIALSLARPEHTQLRRDYLGLSAPRPQLFLTREEFDELLTAAGARNPGRLVGRDSQLKEVSQCLADGQTVIMEAAGGMGKSRLLVELARIEDRWRWLFVRDGLPFSPEMLHETGVGDDVAVVIDDAHRRGHDDLRAMLAALERRTPRVRLVLVARPGFRDKLQTALAGLAHGSAASVVLPPLSRQDMAVMLEEPPLSVRFGGARAAIVNLARGNPQIATIAAELSSRGLALHELSRADLMRSYVAAILREAAGDSRELLALIALIAAVGTLELYGDALREASQALGLPEPHLLREIAALADRGILIEDQRRVSVKPDVLAERILIGCFFDRSWRPALHYGDIYGRFAASRRDAMLAVLSQAMVAEPDETRQSDELAVVSQDVLDACVGARDSDTRADAAGMLSAVAPGLPGLAVQGVDLLLDQLPEDADQLVALCTPVVNVLTRISDFAAGWQRLLTVAERLFAAVPVSDPLVDRRHSRGDPGQKAVSHLGEAFAEILRRLPVDQSSRDGQVLAGVQNLMARITPSWWETVRNQPGAPAAALLASRVMMTVIYEVIRTDAANPNINLIAVGVPANVFTERCVAAGIRILLDCLPRLSLRGQIRGIESLQNLAHSGLGGAPGPFGLQLSDETKGLINRLFDDLVAPWIRMNLDSLPLPVAADAIELLQWRQHFGRPTPDAPLSPELDEYRELIQPGGQWIFAEDPFAHRHARLEQTAERHARALLADSAPAEHLDRWGSWYEQRVEAKGAPPSHETLALALERVTQQDPELGLQLVTRLVDTESPLLWHAQLAMTAVLTDKPDRALRWAQSPSSAVRATLTWAAPHLRDDSLQRQIFELMANDSDDVVRSTAARALRYRTDLRGWKIRVALKLIRDDGDLETLSELLTALAETKPSSVLTSDTLDQVKAALMEAARNPRSREGHLLAEAIEAMRSLGHDLLWDWVWARIDALSVPHIPFISLTEALPVEVMALVGRRADTAGVGEHVEHALGLLGGVKDWRVEEALIQIVTLLGAPELVLEHLREWATGPESRRRHLYAILERVHDPALFERYAAAVLAADASLDTIDRIVFSREPKSFAGSRVPYYEAARDQFRAWETHSDGNLVRASHRADEIFNQLIDQARTEDERRMNAYLE